MIDISINQDKREEVGKKENKPDEIPAADPEAIRDNLFPLFHPNTWETPLAIAEPISTLGPSGPKELPVPRVTEAAMAFKKGLNALLTSDVRKPFLLSLDGVLRRSLSVLRMLTRTPPQTGTSITLCQTRLMGSSLNHEAPREGNPSQNKSRISCT